MWPYFFEKACQAKLRKFHNFRQAISEFTLLSSCVSGAEISGPCVVSTPKRAVGRKSKEGNRLGWEAGNRPRYRLYVLMKNALGIEGASASHIVCVAT